MNPIPPSRRGEAVTEASSPSRSLCDAGDRRRAHPPLSCRHHYATSLSHRNLSGGACRVALDAELDAWRKKFGTLLLIAQSEHQRTVDLGADDPKYSRLAQLYDTYKRRFAAAQANVARGLSIDSVRCVGHGKALTGKRYKHFRCSATSYVLEIPAVELVFGDDPFLPEVVEGPRRLIGPLPAVFSLHVTGKSRMLSQRAS